MANEPDPKDPDTESESESKEPDHKAEAAKWKEMARKHEASAKKNAEAAKKLAEFEEKDKTESQKLSDAKLAAEKRAEEAELKALRYEVAAEKGLTASQAKRLIGSSKEELETDADELLEAFRSDTDDEDSGKKPPEKTPKPRLKGGKDPETEPEVDIRKMVDSIPRGG